MPSDTKPEDWDYNSTFDTEMYGRLYYRAFERRDGSIRMIRASRTEQREIDRQQAERDNARLSRFDNSMAWVRYTPGRRTALAPVRDPVPASYEGDWLRDASACLPPDVRR